MGHWEYMVLGGPDRSDGSRLELQLNKLGADGWELATASPVLSQFLGPADYSGAEEDTDWFLIMKRRA